VALVNAETSPLAQLADALIPLCAGTERSSRHQVLHRLARRDRAPRCELVARCAAGGGAAAGAGSARAAWQLDWSAAVTHLTPANNLYVIGRGLGLAIAQEAALKLKETCALHAEAVSAAELRHGPMALVRAGFPLLISNDETAPVRELAGRAAQRRAATC